MSFNLLDLVKNHLSGDLISKASSFLGESEGSVGKAVSGIVPSLLGSLISKATSSSDNAGSVLNMAKEAHSGGILGSLGNFFGGDDSLLSKGADLVKGLLGDKAGGIIDMIAGFAGIKSSSASSLMSMAAPVALGALGKHATENNLDAGGFSSLLSSQKNSIMSALPSGLGSLAGMLGLGNIGEKISSLGGEAKAAAGNVVHSVENAAAKGGGAMRILLPLLLLALLVLGALYFWKGCGDHKAGGTGHGDDTLQVKKDTGKGGATVPMTGDIKGKLDTLGNFVYDIGKMIKTKLPSGEEIEYGEMGAEAKLLKMLGDANWKVDTLNKGTGWVTLDNLYFKTGSSELTAESAKRLKNIAAILKAYPTTELKLGGYTDNTGNADANKRLSQSRADAALRALTGMGTAAARMKAEGYGQEHPVCPANDTKECKAQNRRIDVRITKK